MRESTAKNVEAIQQAITQHNRNCSFPASQVRMCWFEVKRLADDGIDEVSGVGLVSDPSVPSGRLRLVCGNEDHAQEAYAETHRVTGERAAA